MANWHAYIAEEKEKEIKELVEGEGLKDSATREFISNCLKDGYVKTNGTDLDKIMPPISRFGGSNRAEKKQRVMIKIITFFERFFGIGE